MFLLDNMTKIFCKAKRARMITRVIRWFDIVRSVRDKEHSSENIKSSKYAQYQIEG